MSCSLSRSCPLCLDSCCQSVLMVLIWMMIVIGVNGQQFNFEVEKRISDRLEFYLGDPVQSSKVISNFRRHYGFPNDMQASDRDQYCQLAYSVSQPLSYYALEDGSFSGYYIAHGYYREPGNAGYLLDDPVMGKHVNTCVDNSQGDEDVPCLLKPGNKYVVCKNNNETRPGLCAEMVPCEGHEDIWCRQYDVKTLEDDSDTPRGHLPLASLCHDEHGRFTNEGLVLNPRGNSRDASNPDNMVACTFENGTPVTKRLEGDFAYCGGNGEVCDNAFAGVFNAFEYDPRYREWYSLTKQYQRSNWSPPYVYVPNLKVGLTYTEPLWDIDPETGRKIFAGALAVDFRLEDIAQFLVDSYQDTDTAILIYEDEEPNYIIATSTGTEPARLVLTSDLESDCPESFDFSDDSCTSIRIPLQELASTSSSSSSMYDSVLVRAANVHMEADYPVDLLSVKSTDDHFSEVYVSQTTLFDSQPGISWRVLIVSLAAVSESDSISYEKKDNDDENSSNALFFGMCFLAGLGFTTCVYFVVYLYRRKKERAVAFADWRFTCAFIAGCALLNVSSFTLLGDNTDAACLSRMWTFHLFFVMALSPLFVKIWRIKKLVGSSAYRRPTITNLQAALYTLPLIMVQALILLIFTFADPPVSTENIENVDGVITQSITCEHDTIAFLIVQLIFDGGVICSGCVLAYMTRNLNDEFGEAKQLIFAMYNIALVGVIIILVSQVANLESNALIVLQTIGVFWGTVFSTAAFVIPRMLQVQQAVRQRDSGDGRGAVRVSGLLPSGPFQSSENPVSSHLGFPLSSTCTKSETDDKDGEMPTSPGRVECTPQVPSSQEKVGT